MPVVPREDNAAISRILPDEGPNKLGCAVRAAIVNQNDLPSTVEQRQYLLEACTQNGQYIFLVEDRDDE
jgi:hypothetical protein